MEKQHCAICDKDELIVDNGESLCMSCGYMTNSKYNLDNIAQIEAFEKQSAKLISDIKQEDKKNNCYWYPSVVDFYKKGIVFPNGTKESWVWSFAPYIPMLPIERITNKIQGTDDLYHEYKIDFTNAKHYDKLEFRLALKNLGEINE